MLCLIKAVIAWVVLMLIGTNLLGFGAFIVFPPSAQAPRWLRRMATVLGYAAGPLGIVYLYALLRYFGFGVLAAATMLMVARLPDLLWEIRNRKRISRGAGPKGAVAVLATLLMWAALPVLELCSNVVDGAKRTGVSLVEESKPWRVGCTPQPGGYAHAAG